MLAQYAGAIAVPSRQLLLTCAAGAFGLGWQNMLVLIVPLRALELGAPPSIIGLIAGAGAAVPAVLSIPFGGIADRAGARAVYAWSALASAVLCVGFALTDSYWGMLGLQLVVGLARNSAWVAAQTYASHLAAAGGRARTMSAFAFTANLGILVAPLASGAVAQAAGYQAAFLVAAVVAAVFAALGLLLPPHQVVKRSGGARWYGDYVDAVRLLRNAGVATVMLLTFVRLFTSLGWGTFYPVLLAGAGYQPGAIGGLVSVQSLAAAALGLSVPWLVRRWSGETVLFASMAGCVVGVVVTPYAVSVPWVVASPMLIGIGSGLSLPLLLGILADDTPAGLRGVAMGLRSCSNQVAATIAPVMLGLVTDIGGTDAAFWSNGLLSGLIVVSTIVLHRSAARAGLGSAEQAGS
jgi:MFS family permease